MAGSYNHVVDDEGRLLDGEGINSMLECRSGDVVECVEEMYGMVWYLASRLTGSALGEALASRATGSNQAANMASVVEEARQNYQEGLRLSPGTGAHLPDEDDD